VRWGSIGPHNCIFALYSPIATLQSATQHD
jgi:hypothetical protein